MRNTYLLKDQLRYMDGHIIVAYVAMIVLSFFMVYLFSDDGKNVTAFVWLSLNITVILIRLVMTISYRDEHRNNKDIHIRYYYWLFYLGIFLTAILWSAGVVLFFEPGSVTKQVILSFFYAGITASAITTLSVRKEYFITYLLLLLLPLIYLFSQEHSIVANTMAVIITIYGLFLLFVSLEYSSMINEGITIRYENMELIHELKQANETAKTASKTKSEFLANMSHEIRTPMTGILGFIEQLAKHEEDPERVRQFDIIKSSGNTLMHIINDILDLSKIESGKMSLEYHPHNIHTIVENITALFSKKITKKKIDFKTDIDTNLPECQMIDKLRFEQVIFNLISNALKFTPKGGNISLRIHHHPSEARMHCSVTDTGIGIDEEHFEKIFTAFGQEDGSTTRKFGGTGLGLTISSKLVEMMQGKLQVESKPGKGSYFYFDIPCTPCPKDITESRENTSSRLNPDNLLFEGHVLIVEDQEFNQLLLGSILKQYNITFDNASDGVEALTLYRQKRYDAIFMDENMPNMNGVEATLQIRNIENKENFRHTPIIAVTANAREEDRLRFLQAGMDGFISKPYLEADVMEAVKAHLSSH